ncbi:signal peptidase II [Candidatus Pelagibacter sp. Uisw_099_02]|uniref:signal peptidase II n=1 Tax=Candidatus Pelagibacter sp. Uisw_099_02 TaxID=3230981 RepID=UPI0039EC8DB5|tara:strand:+ start:701 stop:1198 length:498 start_codon:yes stop_codon:yes gene_type:complete
MNHVRLKNFFLKSLAIILIFLLDRIAKIYILKLAELENTVDFYLTSYLNIYLIWNKGIAFGLFSFDQSTIYNSISLVIMLITILVLIMILNTEGIKQYSLILIFGGSIGNLFDRIYYSAVPDFIDLHIRDFHWFIFNVADIFITFGVIFLILIELKSNKKNDKSI